MNETLISDGWKKAGGCQCGGGASFYLNDNYAGLKIDDYYKGKYMLLRKNHKQVKKVTYNEITQLLQDIKDGVY